MIRVIIYSLAVLCLVAATMLGYALVQTLDQEGGDVQTGRVFGKALIGGPFELVDGDGMARTEADFSGRYMLIYFGFTFCPDVCPTELSSMGQAMDLMGDDAADVQPIFITIDPERDTPEAVKQYVSNFHPRMIGLTGTPEQVAVVAKAYRVYYRKAEDESSSDYLMDHSSYFYLMGPDGEFLKHFSYGTTAEEMATEVLKLVKSGAGRIS